MQYSKADDTYTIIINKGEDAIATIADFCTEEGISNAYFRGIGAVEQLECGYYDLEKKEYFFTTYDNMLEVASLTGNVMLKDDAPFVHMHGVFTDSTNNAFGGHVKEMRVGVTLEVILTTLPSDHHRHLDEAIGLYLIHCPAHS